MRELIWSSRAYVKFGDGTKIDELREFKDPPPVDFPLVTPDFRPYVSENMGHDPVPIGSRREWKEELKKRGLECVDSGNPYMSKKEALSRRTKRTFHMNRKD